ncbi:MAG TPA: phosphotransferase, partial [Candidatus Bathyarchaeia archaeon]|nr:phosphotransferase [Candidatus Bathyarchaeia archaeon]
ASLKFLRHAVSIQNRIAVHVPQVPSFIALTNMNGGGADDFILQRDGQYYALEAIVPGKEENVLEAPAERFFEIGKALGAIHESTVGFTPEGEAPQDQWTRFVYDPALREIILSFVSAHYPESLPLIEKVYVSYLRALPVERYETLPTSIIHGDANYSNFLFDDEGRVSGVIDFEHAARFPRITDFTSVIFKVPVGYDGYAYYDRESLLSLVKGYQSTAVTPLLREELEALPYFLLLEPLSFFLRMHYYQFDRAASQYRYEKIIEYIQTVIADIESGFFEQVADLGSVPDYQAMLAQKARLNRLLNDELAGRVARLKDPKNAFYQYQERNFISEVILDFVGYGISPTHNGEDRARRRARASYYLEKIAAHPEIHAAFEDFVKNYVVQIGALYYRTPSYELIPNFFTGKALWGGQPVLSTTKRGNVRVRVIGAGEKYGRNMRGPYIQQLIRQAVGPDVNIEIVLDDIVYFPDIYEYDEAGDTFVHRRVFDFDENGEWVYPDNEDPNTTIVYKKIGMDEGGRSENIISPPEVFNAAEKYDAVINLNVAPQYYRRLDLRANILTNSMNLVDNDGLLIFADAG